MSDILSSTGNPAPADLNFASDNVRGASPPVLEALVRANDGPATAYGGDAWTRRVERRFAEVFERPVAVFLVGTGTAANALALAALVPPYGSCLCHEEAHVADDECGAPEFYTHGARLIGLPGVGCKLDPATVASVLDALPVHEKQMPPHAVSISQATESGLVYRVEEVAALGELCRSRGLSLHMDGARFANALAALDASPADLTWRAGIDILSFGATKNGCFAAEAVVVFDPARAGSLLYRRKRGGHTFSKGRLVAAQMEGYLADGHWLANARHANGLARRLSEGLAAVPGIRLAWPTEANEVFAVLPGPVHAALRAAGAAYHSWSTRALPAGTAVAPGETLARLIASFATREGDVEAFIDIARRGAIPQGMNKA